MTGLPDLWLPAEQAYTAEPPPARTGQALADEQAFNDIHGPQPDEPRPIQDVPTGDLL